MGANAPRRRKGILRRRAAPPRPGPARPAVPYAPLRIPGGAVRGYSGPVMTSPLTNLLRAASVVACTLMMAIGVSAQQNWSWVNSLPASINWKDVAYGNGTYVAVGGDATIATSPDGITWTISRNSTVNPVLNGVEFANGLFVAVGMGTSTSTGAALVMTSPDGVTWTTNTTVASSFNAQLMDVTYGGGTWVVSGFSNPRILTSTDGLNWTQRSTPGFSTPGRITYGAGRFVAAGSSANILTSTDGTTWTSISIPGATNGIIDGVTFANGKFVAVGRDSSFTAAAFVSTDGTTWTASNAIAGTSNSTGFIDVAGNANGFVAVGGSFVYSSPDGMTWTARTNVMPLAPRQMDNNRDSASGLAFAGTMFFHLGNYGSIATSTDGAAWTLRSKGTIAELGAVLHDGTKFVATGSGGTVLTSPDGTTWTQLTTGITSDLNKAAFGAGRYVAVGFNGILHSANLTSWTAASGTTSDRWAAVAYGGGLFVAANTSTSLGVRTSTDGITWSSARAITGAGGNTNGLVFGNNLFVLTMTGFGSTPSKLYTSSDGVTWTQRASDILSTSTQVSSIAYGGGRFVVLTGDRRSITSTDGVTWTSNTLPSSPSFTRVRYLGDRFYASSSTYGGTNYSSTDGVTWTAVENSSVPNVFGYGFAASGNTVVAVSAQGSIMRGELSAATSGGPTITAAPVSQSTAIGGTATFSVTAPGATGFQWTHNGSNLAGATASSLTLTNVQPAHAGVYSVVITGSGGTTTSDGVVLGLTATAKVTGSGTEVNLNVRHPNGNTYDQVLVTGTAVTVTADVGQVTRTSYIDLNDDIIQLEFSGSGSLTLQLEGATGPAVAANYNQSTVAYMKGRAIITIGGADATTNVTVTSVGRLTAFDPTGTYNIALPAGPGNDPANSQSTLFKTGVTYDGMADVALISISSPTGTFGGVRAAGAEFGRDSGLTGIYAPGVAFSGPLYVHNIAALSTAVPVLITGAVSGNVLVTGGDMSQPNAKAVLIDGITRITMSAGTDSHNRPYIAQVNRGVFQRSGQNVTSTTVGGP